MKVTQVHFRRIYNLGNYENIHVELVAEIEEGEDPKDVLSKLRRQADGWKRAEMAGE